MAKPKPAKWVRLSNGVVEDERGVGQIMLALRQLAVNKPSYFEAAANFVAGGEQPPDFVAARLREIKFAKAGEPLVLYDDVRDVIECCSEWSGKRVVFSSKNLFHQDQSKIVPPGDD